MNWSAQLGHANPLDWHAELSLDSLKARGPAPTELNLDSLRFGSSPNGRGAGRRTDPELESMFDGLRAEQVRPMWPPLPSINGMSPAAKLGLSCRPCA